MKQTFKLDLDIEELIRKFMDYNDGYSGIESYIKHHMTREINTILTKKLEEKLGGDIDGYSTDVYKVARDTWTSSINEKLKTTIDTAFKNSLQSYIDNKLRGRVDSIIDNYIKDYLDSKLMKSLQDFVSGIVVVNSSDIEAERRQLEDRASDQANGAYEAGQMKATQDIRGMI